VGSRAGLDPVVKRKIPKFLKTINKKQFTLIMDVMSNIILWLASRFTNVILLCKLTSLVEMTRVLVSTFQ
jgi:hypothetical protein